jgi:hypothetical protein
MWFNNAKNEYLIECLRNDVAHRDALIKSLEADLDRLRKEKDEEVRVDVQSSTFVIDWKNMDAFSVERMGEAKEAYTIIGYYAKTENDVREVAEWKFYCSQEQHEKLAKEFEAQRK